MTKSDRMIADLIDALDAIHREASKPDASRHYIAGVCEGMIRLCNLQRERNQDGYLVVKPEPVGVEGGR